MVFKYPLVLLAILPWLFLVLIHFLSQNKYSYPVANINFVMPLTNNFRQFLIRYYKLLEYLAFLFLIIALARPQLQADKHNNTQEGIDIILALDTSKSMQLEDLKPNRLEVAKKVARDFVSQRTTDRIGIITFAELSFLHCPLTVDYNIVNNLIKHIEIGSVLEGDGTAIGLAITSSLNRLREKNTSSASKIIILITDGENNAGSVEPVQAIELAKVLGIRVYTIGVGKTGLIKVPIQTPFGIIHQQVKSQIDEELLMKVANETGGVYYRATNEKILRQIFDKISVLEKTKIEVQSYIRYKDIFYIFIIFSLFCLFLFYILKFTYCKVFP